MTFSSIRIEGAIPSSELLAKLDSITSISLAPRRTPSEMALMEGPLLPNTDELRASNHDAKRMTAAMEKLVASDAVGDLEIDRRLLLRLVPGVEQAQRDLLVAGLKALLFSGEQVLAVAGFPAQEEEVASSFPGSSIALALPLGPGRRRVMPNCSIMFL